MRQAGFGASFFVSAVVLDGAGEEPPHPIAARPLAGVCEDYSEIRGIPIGKNGCACEAFSGAVTSVGKRSVGTKEEDALSWGVFVSYRIMTITKERWQRFETRRGKIINATDPILDAMYNWGRKPSDADSTFSNQDM
jgi:hypothetical protein